MWFKVSIIRHKGFFCCIVIYIALIYHYDLKNIW
jgi:hypothetical protein